MPDYILLMHGDTDAEIGDWAPYLETLKEVGALRGGSAVGEGITLRRTGHKAPVTKHITGFVRIEASNLDQAKELVAGNPVYEAGGTVEIRELPLTD